MKKATIHIKRELDLLEHWQYSAVKYIPARDWGRGVEYKSVIIDEDYLEASAKTSRLDDFLEDLWYNDYYTKECEKFIQFKKELKWEDDEE